MKYLLTRSDIDQINQRNQKFYYQNLEKNGFLNDYEINIMPILTQEEIDNFLKEIEMMNLFLTIRSQKGREILLDFESLVFDSDERSILLIVKTSFTGRRDRWVSTGMQNREGRIYTTRKFLKPDEIHSGPQDIVRIPYKVSFLPNTVFPDFDPYRFEEINSEVFNFELGMKRSG